jgi:YbgC/YbaW family acyl-CoA thioester hydrolase
MFNNWKQKGIIKETESEAIIRFQDCDPLQHLNNSKYFDYFFNGREDQVAKLYDFRLNDVYKKFNAGWVVYNHNISYLRPARINEWVKIKSRIIYVDDNTIVVEYFMTDLEIKTLKCVLISTLKYVDVTSGKTINHHPEVKEFLDAIRWMGNKGHVGNMKERIEIIKTSLIKEKKS